MMPNESLSVSQLNTFIRDVIQAGFPQAIWVHGEIQGYDRQKEKNHIFFQLIEKDADTSQQKATIDLVIWSGNKPLIQEILASAAETFTLCDGIEVKFSCRVDFYPPHGRVRLSIESIDPFFTLGKLAQERQKLIETLAKEGVLEKNKQCELSPAPLAIGLITSDDSAAYNDFISELQKSGYAFKVFVRNCLMQGKRSEKDVCDALEELGRIKGLEAVVITRGGGSLSDLSSFDSERIARKIAGFALPVLSGIGHEINITVTDLAAHTHAKTPTAIAQFLVARVQGVVERLDDAFERLGEASLALLETGKEDLRSKAIGLQAKTAHYLEEHMYALIRFCEKIKQRPLEQIKQSALVLKDKYQRIDKAASRRIEGEARRLSGFERTVKAYHPKNTLKRGFTITRDDKGRSVRRLSDVALHTKIRTELFDGSMISEIQQKDKE